MKVESAIYHVVDGDIELMIREVGGGDTILRGEQATVALKSLKAVRKDDTFVIMYTPKKVKDNVN